MSLDALRIREVTQVHCKERISNCIAQSGCEHPPGQQSSCPSEPKYVWETNPSYYTSRGHSVTVTHANIGHTVGNERLLY